MQEIESNTWTAFFYIALFLFIGFSNSQLQSLTFFRAANYPQVADTETLPGFEYSPYRIHLQRGQLVLADIDGARTLVRVIATSGDIYVPGKISFQVNGASIPVPLQNRTDTDALTSALRDLVQLISYPGDHRYPALPELGREELLGHIRESDTIIVPSENYLVARNQDLLINYQPKLPATMLRDLSIVAVPWAKLWPLGDHPGSTSDLVQPSVVFAN